MLSRVCDLQKDIATFLRPKNLPYTDQLFDSRWLARLALLTDITTHLLLLRYTGRTLHRYHARTPERPQRDTAGQRHSRNRHARTHHRLQDKDAIVGGAIG